VRVLIQRVTASHVNVDGCVVGKIGKGLTLLVGIAPTDTSAELAWMAKKCLNLRLFPSDAVNGSVSGSVSGSTSGFDRSVQDIGGELLVVSQFTLYADVSQGRRPSFTQAAPPQQAEVLYEEFVDYLRQSGLTVATGQFGASMRVFIENDGPVTLWLER
jgi:D-aminoacyl-tRNA deacylase